jgi:hypothetical protein
MIFIVDTNLLFSATTKPTASHDAKTCRAILECILANRHKIGMSTPLKDEYKEHCSKYSKTWYTIMRQHGCIEVHRTITDQELRDELFQMVSKIFQQNHLDSIWGHIEKDVHLFELAFLCNRLIISNECNCRNRIRRIAIPNKQHLIIVRLQEIFWIRPCECACNNFELLQWMKNGARISEIPNECILIPA